MKKKINILGSTGSIGNTTLKIINLNSKLFTIETLMANKNFYEIQKQIDLYNPKNFVVSNYDTYLKVAKKFKKKNVKIYNHFESVKINKKIDITVAAIPGLAGLKPTLKFTKKSKTLLIANKETVICGWKLLNNIVKKYKIKVIPIDSEHFSIMKLIEKTKKNEVEKIYITASGGPFLKKKIKDFKKITPSQALKHPKWSMGKKISIDSATMMNKIFEILEAERIFSYPLSMFKIIIHPQSLIHAIVKYKNGITKFLYHEPDMSVPISNAIFGDEISKVQGVKKREIDLSKIEFFNVDKKRFPSMKLLPNLEKYPSTPIILNAANEILVDQFLKKKIRFNGIIEQLLLVLKDKNYKKYAIQKPNNLKNIYSVDLWTRSVVNLGLKKYD